MIERDESALDRAIAAMTEERKDWVDDPDEVARGLAVARLLVANGARLVLFPPAFDGGTWNPRGGHGYCGYRLTPGWQHLPYDSNVVSKWRPGDALALLCGHVYDAVDNDPRNGGDAIMKQLAPYMPATIMIQDTPSEGQHHLVPTLGIAKAALAGVDIQAGLDECDMGSPKCNGGHGFIFLAPTRKWSKTLGRVDRYRWVTPASGLLNPGLSDASALREEIVAIRNHMDITARLRRGENGERKERAEATGDRLFSAKQADAFIETQVVQRLRAAPQGQVANTLFAASALLGHFVPDHISHDDAVDLMVTTLGESEGNDGTKSWDEMHEINNGLAVGANEWTATMISTEETLNVFGRVSDTEAILVAQGGLRLDDRYRPGVISPAGSTDPGFKLGAPRTEVFLSDEFWESRPVFRHLRAVAQSKLASPEGVLIAGLSLAIAHTMPNLVLPACVGVEASLNLMTVICGGSGDGKSVCRKLASEALNFAGVKEPWIFNPSSGQGVAGQYQYLKKERGQPARMERSRHRALAMVEESDTIRALSANPNSTLSSELRKAAMGETLGFGNIGETQTNLPEHSYRFVMMMCMQPDLADWLLGDAAGGLPQRFVWACVRDPRVVRGVEHPGVFEIRLPIEARPSPMPALTQDGRVDVAASEKDENGKVNVFASSVGSPRSRYVMPISEAVCEEIFEAAIQRKIRGDEAGTDYDGHALLARLKIAGGIALLDGRSDLRDDDWKLAAHVVAASSATRDWVQQRVSDMAVRANVKAAHAKGHARVVEESVVETQAKARCANAILGHLERNPDGLPKAELKRKIKAELRHLVDEKDGVLDALLASGQVRFEDILKGDQQVGSRWFRVI